ncbi:hypothetical protein [Streptomyces toxytricini]|uniref:hypothetical protein n=1 Tax=Streptomyces toxytricini TaxID=67369 RepID=UPI0034221CCC
MTAHAPDGTALGLGPNQQRALLAVLLLRRGRPAPMADLPTPRCPSQTFCNTL